MIAEHGWKVKYITLKLASLLLDTKVLELHQSFVDLQQRRKNVRDLRGQFIDD